MKINGTVGIIAAMQLEADAIAQYAADTVSHRLGKFTYITGTLAGHPVVIARCGAGKVNAAACTAGMILRFAPGFIINAGVAGALDPSLEIGDVVIAAAAVEHDLDYAELGDPRGTVFYPDGSEEVFIPADREISAALRDAARAAGCRVTHGDIATGDRFVASEKERAAIHSYFGSAVCCEMEGAAVAHTCRLYGTPYAVIRSISDHANGDSHIDFPTFARQAAGAAADTLVKFLSRAK